MVVRAAEKSQLIERDKRRLRTLKYFEISRIGSRDGCVWVGRRGNDGDLSSSTYMAKKRTHFHTMSRVSSGADPIGMKKGFKEGAISGTTVSLTEPGS